MENQTGINVEAIRKLCLDINDYSDKIRNTLSQVSDTWDDVKPYIKDNGMIELENKYSSLKDSFDVIYNNFASYIDEFNSLTSKYERFDTDLSREVTKDAENLEWKEGQYANN